MAPRFVFIPLTDDEAASRRSDSTPLVRAHVTRLRHANSNTRNAMQAKQPWTVIPYKPRKGRNSASISSSTGSSLTGSSDTDETAEKVKIETGTCSLVPIHHGAILPTFLGSAQQEDPFWSYPVDHQRSLSPIFAHYIENLAVNIPDLDGEHHVGLLRRRWFPLAMTEPATMYAVLLLAASHYAIVNPSLFQRSILLRLKARALNEINIALEDTSRAVNDAVIGAVMKMAAYEAIFGDPEAYLAHMRGLKLMIKLRGGLAELGLDGLLERMLVWIDLNAAHLTGSNTTLGGADVPTEVKLSGPDPYHFAGVS